MQGRGGERSPQLGGTRKGLQGGHCSPDGHSKELGDKCKGLQARGGHSSPELGDKWKGLQGRGWHHATRRETKGDKQTEGRQGGHNDQQESFTCAPQLWTAASTFTCVSQLWAAASASALQSFTLALDCSGRLSPAILYISLSCCIRLCLAVLCNPLRMKEV